MRHVCTRRPAGIILNVGASVNRRIVVRRRGAVLIYSVLALVALTALASLAVDFGRVQLAKTELRRTCDAAARYAVTGIASRTTLTRANHVGAHNTADGVAYTFPAGDVEVGTWNETTRAFTPGGAAPNAVRTTARRTRATQNPIPTVLARGIGIESVDVTVQSVAFTRMTGYGVVGLSFIYMTGNSSDSYWSGGQAGASGSSQHGSIASNGNIILQGSSSISGNARPGVGKAVFGAASVSGSTQPLEYSLEFPNGDAGIYATTNDNNLVPSSFKLGSGLKVGSSQTLTLPGGNYYFNNIEIGGTLKFTGPATIYCYGNFSMYGQADTSGNVPGNLKLVMCPGPSGAAPGSVVIGSGAELYANIYAPQSHILLSGNGDIYGTVLGLSVSMTGTSAIHYDLALHPDNGRIALVQ